MIKICLSYNPELTSDPFAEDGCLWFFNFFMYNKKMKRIVFLSCRCTSKSIEEDEDMTEELTSYEPTTSDKPAWTYSIDFTSKSKELPSSSNQSSASKPVHTVIG